MSNPIPLRIALGGDHAGFSLKQAVAARLAPQVSSLIDCGTDSDASCRGREYLYRRHRLSSLDAECFIEIRPN